MLWFFIRHRKIVSWNCFDSQRWRQQWWIYLKVNVSFGIWAFNIWVFQCDINIRSVGEFEQYIFEVLIEIRILNLWIPWNVFSRMTIQYFCYNDFFIKWQIDPGPFCLSLNDPFKIVIWVENVVALGFNRMVRGFGTCKSNRRDGKYAMN